MKRFITVFLAILLAALPAAAAPAAEGGADFAASSPHALFMDMNTGRVLYEKDADAKIYPASTVKIMTVILALENCSLEDKVTASETALSSVPDGVTAMDIMPGEELTVRQLAYGAMLASAADATNVLGEAVGGSVSDFVQLMNDKAKELGMNDTNFSNTHGEHDDRTYTTVRDMAVLARYAMQNEDFREIVKTDRYSVQPTNRYKETRSLINTNYMVSRVQRADYYYDKAIGVKAGYTSEAGSCLVEVAKNRDMELLALTFGSETVDGKAQGYTDCLNFFSKAFETYKSKLLVTKGRMLDQLPIRNARRAAKVLLEAGENLYYLYPENEEDGEVTFDVRPTAGYVRAPVGKGDVLGEVEYFYNGVSAGVIPLVADRDYSFDPLSYIGDSFVGFVTSPIFIILVIAVAAALIYIRVRRVKAKQRKQRLQRERRRREAAARMRDSLGDGQNDGH